MNELMSIEDKDISIASAPKPQYLTAELMQEAKESWAQLGYPTTKNEEWKYTSLAPFLKEDYATGVPSTEIEEARHLLAAHLKDIKEDLKGAEKGAHRVVMLNNVLVPEMSYLPEQEGVTVCSFADATAHPAFLKNLGTIAIVKNNALAAKNTAEFTEGLFIHVAANVQVAMPLHIIHIYLYHQPTAHAARALTVLEKNAQLELIETTIATGDNALMLNDVHEISLAPQAIADHYIIQKGWKGLRQILRTEVRQLRDSNYSNYTFTLPGCDIQRNNLSLHLDDSNIECHLYGLYLTNGKQLVDNHTDVHHKFPNGESNQLYKGVLLGESKAVFNGKILVYEDAQKTNAFQQSNNVLFSDKATVHAKPQLEIFADDVKCSHGTTIGQLNEDALFYLKSRGLGEQSARRMLVNAFAFDVAERVKNPALRQYLEEIIAKEL